MKVWKLLAVLSVSVFVLVSSKPALGHTVTVYAEAVLVGVDIYDAIEFDESLIVGETIMRGVCTYDSEAPDQDWPDDFGLYSVISISITAGNYTFTHDPAAAEGPYFSISAGAGGFYYYVISLASFFYGPCWFNGQPSDLEDLVLFPTWAGLAMFFDGDSASAIGDALPDEDTFPDLSVFNGDNTYFYITSGTTPVFSLYGEITSLTVVPEPASAVVLGVGAGMLILRRKRR